MILKHTLGKYEILKRFRPHFKQAAYYLDNRNPLYVGRNIKLSAAENTGILSDVLLILGSNNSFSQKTLLHMIPSIEKLISIIAGAIIEIRSSADLLAHIDIKSMEKAMLGLTELLKTLKNMEEQQSQ
jgi:hypothetical protein